MSAALAAGIRAFRESALSADQLDQRTYSALASRQLRYALYWAFYENTAYRDIHLWSKKFRADYGLYKYIRGIHNPAYRLGEFYATHLMGGALDLQRTSSGMLEAGDTGAIPIATEQDGLRRAIATLWQASNWAVQKDIWTRSGSMLGDIALKIEDDPLRQKVYLCIVNPGTITDLEKDAWGHVKRYQIEEQRPDPRPLAQRARSASDQAPTVIYGELAMRDGDNVVYQTTLNGTPYPWNGVTPQWQEPYGFIPLVVTQHLNVGLDWGWSELHAGHGKFQEADDLASKLSDQIRKTVDAPMLLAGVNAPTAAPTVAGADPSATRPQPGREEAPVLYSSNADAKAHPLLAPLDIASVSERIKDIIAEIERDYPELQMDIWTASGDASGRALRVARQRVSGKVQMRRAGYDADLVRAQQMGVAIGGYRGYQGYEGFNLDSYAGGKLDHQIGARPIFEVDPLDQTEQDQAFWTAAAAADRAGYPLDLFLEEHGWDARRIARVTAEQERRRTEARAIAQQRPAGAPPNEHPQ